VLYKRSIKRRYHERQKLGEEALAEGTDEYLLKAMARVYWELWEDTRLQEYRDRWSNIGSALEAFGDDARNGASRAKHFRETRVGDQG